MVVNDNCLQTMTHHVMPDLIRIVQKDRRIFQSSILESGFIIVNFNYSNGKCRTYILISYTFSRIRSPKIISNEFGEKVSTISSGRPK